MVPSVKQELWKESRGSQRTHVGITVEHHGTRTRNARVTSPPTLQRRFMLKSLRLLGSDDMLEEPTRGIAVATLSSNTTGSTFRSLITKVTPNTQDGGHQQPLRNSRVKPPLFSIDTGGGFNERGFVAA